MRNYLLARGLWELTQGTANAPESKQELDFFNRRFYQTNSILVGSCSRDITLSLEWSTDPHATWNYLENQYQPLGISQRYEAFMDFMDLRYDGKNITTYCQQYQVRLQRCRQLDIALDNDLMMYPFIREITPYFEGYAVLLRTQMDNHTGKKGTAPFTLDQIVSRVLHETRQQNTVYNTRTGKDKSTNASKDHNAKGGKQNSNDKRNATCSHCDITGHSHTDCFHLHPNKAPEGWKLRRDCTKPNCKAKNQENQEDEAANLCL